MSRLFSRLENIGHDHGEGAPSAPPVEPGQQADAHADAAALSPTNAGSDTGTPIAAANAPTMRPLVPGYSILSSLAMPSSPTPRPVAARPVWPVRIWLVSLLLLIGLSLLVLAMPGRLLPHAVQPAPPERTSEVGAPEIPAAVAPAVTQTPAVAAEPESPVVPSAGAIVTPVPAARAPRTETSGSNAAVVPTTPSRATGGAACSEAMFAMNLCRKSSP